MIRVKYNKETGLVEGNYPKSINYRNNNINEEDKTIDGSPYIEITQEEQEFLSGKVVCIIDGKYQEYVKPDDVLLEEAKYSKKSEVKSARNKEFSKPLQARGSLYLKTQPEVNIFLAAYSMADGSVKEWAPCDVNGEAHDNEVSFSKFELVSVSNHYEDRKTTHYNQSRRRCRAIEALTSIEEVESYDITQVYES